MVDVEVVTHLTAWRLEGVAQSLQEDVEEVEDEWEEDKGEGDEGMQTPLQRLASTAS